MESLGRDLSEMDALRMRLSLKHLIEPERGMGEVFKVLIQPQGNGPTSIGWFERSRLHSFSYFASLHPSPRWGEGVRGIGRLDERFRNFRQPAKRRQHRDSLEEALKERRKKERR